MQSIPMRCVAFLSFALAFILIPLPAAAQEETAVPESRLAEILAGGTPENVDELRALQGHVQRLVERVLPATVSIPYGSGVLVRGDDSTYVLSAGHVIVSKGRELSIELTDGVRLQGVTQGADHPSDVGLIQVHTETEHPVVEIGTSADLKEGQWVLMLGHSTIRKPGRTAPVRLGRVLYAPESGYIVSDCTMQWGDSGGPLFDMDGRVVGINSRNNRNLAMNLHAPIDALVKQWAELKLGKVTPLPLFGRNATLRGVQSVEDRIRSLSQGDAMRKTWASASALANPSVVRVLVGDAERALGTVVAPDLVVTKYSELAVDDGNAKRTCRQGERSWPYSIVGFDRPADIALLRIASANLEPIAWHDEIPGVGALLASPDGASEPIGIGVLSAAPYQHTAPCASLGVRSASLNKEPATLDEVLAHGAARAAGLRSGDIVLQFGQERVDNCQQLSKLVSTRSPGDKVRVTVERGDAELTFEITLENNREPIQTKQEYVWGPLSEVRSGFDTVLQHDTVLKPEHCGGPVIDLDGHAIGMNIARAGRVETLAIPASEVQRIVAGLLTASKQAKLAEETTDTDGPETDPLYSDGVLKPDNAISDYINRWGKHLLKQDRDPNPSILSRLGDRWVKSNRLKSELSRILDRQVDLIEPSNVPLSSEELLEICLPGVLVISGIMESNRIPPGHASGFVISEDGLALTNHHVMQTLGRGDLVVATTLSGRVVRVKEILAANEADDVALIQLEGDGFHPLPIAKSAMVGSDLVAISHPGNAFFSLTEGLLARRTRVSGRHRIMVTTEFAVGSSGGPILDRFGSVAGMVERTQSIAKKTVPVQIEKGAFKLGKSERASGLFLNMDHEMTLRYAVPCQSLRAFLRPLPLDPASSGEVGNPIRN